MKISYNWLKTYLDIDLPAEEAGKLLTNCGLEVEHIEKLGFDEKSLQGLIVAEVKEKFQHPNADRLSVTKLFTGKEELLQVVCGAANVAAGQKVVLAPVGQTIQPKNGESFQIKKAKIRGELSEGMICAEDEIGIGNSHEGIIVLPSLAEPGMPASRYLKLPSGESDHIFEIGLTPNRPDAASHLGVARDLAAVTGKNLRTVVKDNVGGPGNAPISVKIEDTNACPRYSGIYIKDVQVKESPEWLQSRLKAIGLRPINNVVDATNFILHSIGQPIHAFDADKIRSNRVIVKNAVAGSKFTTLDGVERKMEGTELMIWNDSEPMAMAGVFGGQDSGVTEKTKNLFIESAYFNPVTIRKAAKLHGLHTDASFRYERGTDPNICVIALRHVASLILEIAGGSTVGREIDEYPNPVEPFEVKLSFTGLKRLSGIDIGYEKIQQILISLGIRIKTKTDKGLILEVPAYKVDVTREADVIEEILRIYGYDNIPIPEKLHASIGHSVNPDKNLLRNKVADLLAAQGFFEAMTNSLNPEEAMAAETAVKLLNPLSQELSDMRQSFVYNLLQAVSYNLNRKQEDVRLFEFGKTYHKNKGTYKEVEHLALIFTGNRFNPNWNTPAQAADIYQLKGLISNCLRSIGLQGWNEGSGEEKNMLISQKLNRQYLAASVDFLDPLSGRVLVQLGLLNNKILKEQGIDQPVFFADINWALALELAGKIKIQFRGIPKFPEVRRDLSLVLDKHVEWEQLRKIALKAGQPLVTAADVFDTYQGANLGEGKKSYSLKFTLLNPDKTLTDEEIDKTMNKLMQAFEKEAGALIRK